MQWRRKIGFDAKENPIDVFQVGKYKIRIVLHEKENPLSIHDCCLGKTFNKKNRYKNVCLELPFFLPGNGHKNDKV